MAPPPDFRTVLLTPNAISESGKYLGRSSYWRLYAIENTFRVITHSILSVQIGPGWWALAVDPKIDNKVQRVRNDYREHPHRPSPGGHNIYYLFLTDLTKIIALHSGLFQPIIPDIDHWIARLESIRLPRNVVVHMNWLSDSDRQDVDTLYRGVRRLLLQLQNSGFQLSIP